MQDAETARAIRTSIIESLKGRPAQGEPVREALHAAFIARLRSTPALDADQVRLMARSGLEALLLAGGGPVEGSVDVMQAVVECAARLNLDTAVMMRSALTGIAEVGQKAPNNAAFSMKMALEEAFSGLGPAFDEALREVKAAGLRA